MRSFLFNNNKDDEVLVVQDSSNAEEYQRLKNSVLKIKMMVYRTSLQFKLPYAEVLRRAAEMHKQERSAAATVSTATSSNGSQGAQAAVIVTAGATTVAVSSNLTRNLLTRTINSGVNGKRRVHESDGCGLSNQPPPKIQALLSSAAAATASPAASSALPTTVALPQTPVVLPTIVLPNAPGNDALRAIMRMSNTVPSWTEFKYHLKGVAAKMSLRLSISGHTLMMESLKLGLRVTTFKEENNSNNLTLGPSLEDSVTKVWPEIERLIDIFAVTPFMLNLLRCNGHERAGGSQVQDTAAPAVTTPISNE